MKSLSKSVLGIAVVAGLAASADASSTMVNFSNLVADTQASPPAGAGVRRTTFNAANGVTVKTYADPRGFAYQTWQGVRGLGVIGGPSGVNQNREINGSEFILLTFSQPVYINRMDIAQIYNESGVNETAHFIVNPTLGGSGVQFVGAVDDSDTNGIGANLGGSLSTIAATGHLTSATSGFNAGTTVALTTLNFLSNSAGALNAGNIGTTDGYTPGANNPAGVRSIRNAATEGIFGRSVTSLLMRVDMTQFPSGAFDGADFSFVQFGMAVVPLPPAGWAGLATLAGVVGVGYIRRRRQLA